ncbi:unnamed protein product [Lampetra fluviatilis]
MQTESTMVKTRPGQAPVDDQPAEGKRLHLETSPIVQHLDERIFVTRNECLCSNQIQPHLLLQRDTSLVACTASADTSSSEEEPTHDRAFASTQARSWSLLVVNIAEYGGSGMEQLSKAAMHLPQ